MKITKIAIGKGRSVPKKGPEGEWDKVFYHVEAEVSESEDPEAVRIGLEATLDSWLAQPPTTPEWIPKLDIGEVNDLIWTTYKTKERAKPSEAAWTFSGEAKHDNPEHKFILAELIKAIKASPNERLELGDMEHSFSGAENQFISRRPAKKS